MALSDNNQNSKLIKDKLIEIMGQSLAKSCGVSGSIANSGIKFVQENTNNLGSDIEGFLDQVDDQDIAHSVANIAISEPNKLIKFINAIVKSFNNLITYIQEKFLGKNNPTTIPTIPEFSQEQVDSYQAYSNIITGKNQFSNREESRQDSISVKPQLDQLKGKKAIISRESGLPDNKQEHPKSFLEQIKAGKELKKAKINAQKPQESEDKKENPLLTEIKSGVKLNKVVAPGSRQRQEAQSLNPLAEAMKNRRGAIADDYDSDYDSDNELENDDWMEKLAPPKQDKKMKIAKANNKGVSLGGMESALLDQMSKATGKKLEPTSNKAQQIQPNKRSLKKLKRGNTKLESLLKERQNPNKGTHSK